MIFNQIYPSPHICKEYKQQIWQQIITNWSTKCVFLYCAFMSYMSTATCMICICITVNTKFWWEEMVHDFFYDERITKYMLFNKIENSSHTHQFIFNNIPITISIGIECHKSRCCMTKISRWMQLIEKLSWFFSLSIWTADIIDVGFINLVHTFLLWPWRFHLTQHIGLR